VDLDIEPPPSPEEERAIRAALAEDDVVTAPYQSLWASAALDDLRDDPPLEDPRGDARVVEP
jgi:hypothetical protein